MFLLYEFATSCLYMQSEHNFTINYIFNLKKLYNIREIFKSIYEFNKVFNCLTIFTYLHNNSVKIREVTGNLFRKPKFSVDCTKINMTRDMILYYSQFVQL